MKAIIFGTILTAFVFGFSVYCIIDVIYISVKCLKCGKRIRVKDYHTSSMWWYIAFAILHGLKAITEIYGLEDCTFTESVLSKINILSSLLIFFSFILAFFLRTRVYITEKGIITSMSFLLVPSVKYSVKTEDDVYIISLYTKKEKPSYTFCTKKQTAVSMLENFYEEADGTAAKVKIKNHIVQYILTVLCTSLIAVGGVFGWYALTKPVVFVGDKIVKTDSEYVLFSYFGYYDLLRETNLQYYGELAEKAHEMYDYVERSENITSDDIAALKQMPNLKYLDVSLNDIDDLTEIGKLTQLEGLAFGGGDMYLKPNDYSPIKNLTNLKYFCGLGLYNCNDLTIFKDMDNLIYFELTAAEIQTSLDIICEKEHLLDLNLYRCTAEDFSPIGKCVKLKSLSLSSTNVTDLSFLENLTELEQLNIDDVKAEDYSILLELPKLNKLYAKNAGIPNYIVNKLAAKGVDVQR